MVHVRCGIEFGQENRFFYYDLASRFIRGLRRKKSKVFQFFIPRLQRRLVSSIDNQLRLNSHPKPPTWPSPKTSSLYFIGWMIVFSEEKSMKRFLPRQNLSWLERIGIVNTILLLFHAIFVISIVVTALGSPSFSGSEQKYFTLLVVLFLVNGVALIIFMVDVKTKNKDLLSVYLTLDIPG